MIQFLFGIFLIAVFPFPNTGWTSEQLVVGDFSRQPLNDNPPRYWEPLVFDDIDTHTVYTHVLDEGIGVIQAKSRASSSGLIRKITIDPSRYPVVSFRWKIQNILESADLTHKGGNDASARVYITFAYDSSQVAWLEQVGFEAIKLFHSEYPPIATLIYVWASYLEKGTIIESPYTSRAKIIVLESGADKKGQWVSEKRNIYEDYRMAFGSENVPMISGVAVMTDTDNTCGQAFSWYGDIVFSGSPSK
jgi:Protein of unknown function (DUF3047)